MLFHTRAFSMLMMSTLLMSTLMMLSSTNWLFMWCGLEINLLSFIPLMMMSNKFQEQEAATKYFLIQALGSSLILMASSSLWINNLTPEPSYILISAILLKLGMAPCHFWFPSVMSSISWINCLILSTWQKLGPLMIMSFILQSMCLPKIFIIISSINAITGGLMGMNQSKVKSIMAYSSITHMGWMTSMLITLNPLSTMMYFIMYSVLLTPLFLFMSLLSINTQPQMQKASNSYKYMNILIPLMILSISGMPPLSGFLPKLLTIYTLMPEYMALLIIMLMGAMMNMFFYLNITFSTMNSPNYMNKSNMNYPSTMLTLSSMSLLVLIPSLVMIT